MMIPTNKMDTQIYDMISTSIIMITLVKVDTKMLPKISSADSAHRL